MDKEPVNPSDVVTNILKAEDEVGKAALTHLKETLETNASAKTLAELREEAVRDICRDRTSVWLDEMCADGQITPDEREAFAADRGTEQLGRLLRVVEQAGHDPKEALVAAVGERSLGGARSLGQMLYARVRDAHEDRMAPDPDLAQQPPVQAAAAYVEHLDEIRDRARERELELGAEQADTPSTWATETLGPVPEDDFERMAWEERAGRIALQREADGWEDEQRPLAPSPGASQPEARAAWHTAWDAAGHPDTRSAEQELSEGLLRTRVRAMQRENDRLPPSVFDEMVAVERELRDHQNTSDLLYAQADGTEDEHAGGELRAQAAEAGLMAMTLREKRNQLQVVDDERTAQYEASAMTRDLGNRAFDELETRGVQVDHEADRMTGEQWWSEIQEARAREEADAVVYEQDAPSEVWDQELEDFVQLPDEIIEAEPVEEVPAIEQDYVVPDVGTVDAEIVPDEAQLNPVERPANEVLPEGVPPQHDLDAMTLATRLAAEEADNRAALVEAQQADDASTVAVQESDEVEEYA